MLYGESKQLFDRILAIGRGKPWHVQLDCSRFGMASAIHGYKDSIGSRFSMITSGPKRDMRNALTTLESFSVAAAASREHAVITVLTMCDALRVSSPGVDLEKLSWQVAWCHMSAQYTNAAIGAIKASPNAAVSPVDAPLDNINTGNYYDSAQFSRGTKDKLLRADGRAPDEIYQRQGFYPTEWDTSNGNLVCTNVEKYQPFWEGNSIYTISATETFSAAVNFGNSAKATSVPQLLTDYMGGQRIRGFIYQFAAGNCGYVETSNKAEGNKTTEYTFLAIPAACIESWTMVVGPHTFCGPFPFQRWDEPFNSLNPPERKIHDLLPISQR